MPIKNIIKVDDVTVKYTEVIEIARTATADQLDRKKDELQTQIDNLDAAKAALE